MSGPRETARCATSAGSGGAQGRQAKPEAHGAALFTTRAERKAMAALMDADPVLRRAFDAASRRATRRLGCSPAARDAAAFSAAYRALQYQQTQRRRSR